MEMTLEKTKEWTRYIQPWASEELKEHLAWLIAEVERQQAPRWMNIEYGKWINGIVAGETSLDANGVRAVRALLAHYREMQDDLRNTRRSSEEWREQVEQLRAQLNERESHVCHTRPSEIRESGIDDEHRRVVNRVAEEAFLRAGIPAEKAYQEAERLWQARQAHWKEQG